MPTERRDAPELETVPAAQADLQPNANVERALLERQQDFLGFLMRRLGRRELAEDLLQETLAHALPRLDSLRDDEAVVPWFYRALRNATVDHLRRTQVADRALERFANELEASEDPATDVREGLCQCVVGLSQDLKPQYAAALQRIEVDGVPVKQFAQEEGITASNAGVRVFRAREALKKRVASYCGGCAEHGCNPCTCGT